MKLVNIFIGSKELLYKVLNKTPNKIPDKTSNRTPNKILDKIFIVKVPDRIFIKILDKACKEFLDKTFRSLDHCPPLSMLTTIESRCTSHLVQGPKIPRLAFNTNQTRR